ncbi:hypothetical protein PTKIN_Ptkin08bG0146600 [Pterospermum kingtungense]
MDMEKRKSGSVVGDKAWKVLRLTLLWARKVCVLKKGLGDKAPSDHQIRCFERQLSFDRSPDHDFHVKKDRLPGSMRFLLPCIGSKTVELDHGIDDDDDVDEFYGNEGEKESYLTDEGREDEEYINGYEKKSEVVEDEGIDSRAEKFIAEFYDQIRQLESAHEVTIFSACLKHPVIINENYDSIPGGPWEVSFEHMRYWGELSPIEGWENYAGETRERVLKIKVVEGIP